MKRWYYVDVTTTCHERVAVKAEDPEDAKDIVTNLVDDGTIDFAEAGNSSYGSINDSVSVDDVEPRRPPKRMRKFDGYTELKNDNGRHKIPV